MNTSAGPAPTPAEHPERPDPRSDPPPRLPAWLRALLTMLLFLPVPIITGVLAQLIPGVEPQSGRLDGPELGSYAVVATITLAGYLLLSWALLRWIDRRPVPALGLRIGVRALLAFLAGCAIAQVISVVGSGAVQALGWGRAPVTGAVDPGTAEVTLGALGVMLGIGVLQAFVLQGIGEEVLFRGYLMQSLRPWPVLAVLIAAVAFAIPHLASNGGQQSAIEHIYYLAIPFGFSLSAGFLAIALRSVWAAVGIHGGFHLATGITASFGIVADGPAAWIALGGLHAVAGIVIALLLPRRRWDEIRAYGPYGRAPSSARPL